MRSHGITCAQCHAPIDDESPLTAVRERKPCPTCGSRMRVAEAEIQELVNVHVPPRSIVQGRVGSRPKR